MRAVAVNPTRRTISVVDLPEPEVTGDTVVKVRLLDVGVCGTDREIASFEFGTPPEGEEHLIIGHEALGEVVEIGAAVDGLAAGDLVVPRIRRPCARDECAPCRAGEPDFCSTGDYVDLGVKGAHGYMAEYAVVENAYLHAIPTPIRHIAVLTEPLTIAEKALRQVQYLQRRVPGYMRPGSDRLPPNHCAVVLGAGAVGILGAMALVVLGYRTYVYSREPTSDPRAALVRSLGATYVSGDEHQVDRLRTVAGQIDLVYEAAGSASLAYEVLGALGTNGIFVFTGVPELRTIEIRAGALMHGHVLKNHVMMGTVSAGRVDFETAIAHLTEFYQRWPDALASMVAARHDMNESERLLTKQLSGIKHVVAIGEDS